MDFYIHADRVVLDTAVSFGWKRDGLVHIDVWSRTRTRTPSQVLQKGKKKRTFRVPMTMCSANVEGGSSHRHWRAGPSVADLLPAVEIRDGF